MKKRLVRAGILLVLMIYAMAASQTQEAAREEAAAVMAAGGVQRQAADARAGVGRWLWPPQELIASATGFGAQEGAEAAGMQAVLGMQEEGGTQAQEAVGDLAQEDEYARLAIARVENYVNVRSEPNTQSDIVGKMYNGSVAQILEAVGEDEPWLKVVSGSVEGYIKAEYFVYGEAAQEVIEDYVRRYARVDVARLNVRSEPSVEAARIGYVDLDEQVRVIEDLGEWIHVQYTEARDGYVAGEYVTVIEEFVYAKSIEEERLEREAAQALRLRETVAEADAPEEVAQNLQAQDAHPAAAVGDADELRTQVVNYAMQYLGNRYVSGGRSLETGTDCSGFTCYVYAAFGYPLARTPGGQLSSAGTSVSLEEIRPGDVVCYGKGRCTHVALYIGGGQIIHAANPRKGVVIGSVDYDTILGVKSIVD